MICPFKAHPLLHVPRRSAVCKGAFGASAPGVANRQPPTPKAARHRFGAPQHQQFVHDQPYRHQKQRQCAAQQQRPWRARAVLCRAAASTAGGESFFGRRSSSSSSDDWSTALTTAAASVAAFVDSQFLPFCLVTGIVMGCANPQAGVEAAKLNLIPFITFTMFVIAGLQLRQEEAMKALKAKGGCHQGVTFAPPRGWGHGEGGGHEGS